MPDVVRVALVQSQWTGDKGSMIDASVKWAREAAAQGAQVLCFQELFYGPYFCQVQDPQYFAYTETIPGPTMELMQDLALETQMVLVVPIYEVEQEGVFYNTAFVIDADGTYLGKYRKHHIPQVQGFWEKYYFRPGNLGYPVFDTAVGPIGVYICYDRHFPEGWRALGLAGAKIVFNPSATSRGLSAYLWNLEQPAAAEQRRVVHQDVDVAPPGEHAGDVVLDRCLVGHVTRRGHRLAAVALDTGDARLDRGLVDVIAGNLRTVPRQRQRDAAADVGPDAGDERDLAVE